MKYALYYPLKPYIRTQKFGESQACTENNDRPITQRKVTGTIWGTNMCLPGYVPLYPLLGMKGHTGIDMHATHGQPLYHCGPKSIVEEIQTEPERGIGLGLISLDMFEAEGQTAQMKLRYWHLKNFVVKHSDIVYPGDLIGYCDNTGLSSGDHLHFELKPVIKNKDSGSYSNILQWNGYFGSIDPEPYFTGEYAQLQKRISTVKTFDTDMTFGDSNNEVKRLQSILSDLGYFTYPENTGNYRSITQQAVYNFQLDNVNLSLWEKIVLQGKTCGPKTRAALNKIINNNKQI